MSNRVNRHREKTGERETPWQALVDGGSATAMAPAAVAAAAIAATRARGARARSRASISATPRGRRRVERPNEIQT